MNKLFSSLLLVLAGVCTLATTNILHRPQVFGPAPIVTDYPEGKPGEAVDGLMLMAQPERPIVLAGERIDIIAKVVNVSSHNVDVNESLGPAEDFAVLVFKSNGQLVGLTSYGKQSYRSGLKNQSSSETGPYSIKTGKSRDYVINLNVIYDMSQTDIYKIVVKRRIQSHKIVVSQPVSLQVESTSTSYVNLR